MKSESAVEVREIMKKTFRNLAELTIIKMETLHKFINIRYFDVKLF